MNDWRIDLIVNLLLHCRFRRCLVNTVCPAPTQNLLFCQVGVRGELAVFRHRERAGGVYVARVGCITFHLCARAAPACCHDHVGQAAVSGFALHPLDGPCDCCCHDFSFQIKKLIIYMILIALQQIEDCVPPDDCVYLTF